MPREKGKGVRIENLGCGVVFAQVTVSSAAASSKWGERAFKKGGVVRKLLKISFLRLWQNRSEGPWIPQILTFVLHARELFDLYPGAGDI